jgi:hypothetical protein
MVVFALSASFVSAATRHGNVPLTITNPTVTISVRLLNHRGIMRLLVEPRVPRGTCSQLLLPMGRGISVSTECGPNEPSPEAIDVGLDLQRNRAAPYQPIWYLLGQVGTNVANLYIRYHSAARQAIPIHYGWVLYPVPTTAPPAELIARDQQGKVIATKAVQQ